MPFEPFFKLSFPIPTMTVSSSRPTHCLVDASRLPFASLPTPYTHSNRSTLRSGSTHCLVDASKEGRRHPGVSPFYIYIIYMCFKSFGWKLLDKERCSQTCIQSRAEDALSWTSLAIGSSIYFIRIDQRVQPATYPPGSASAVLCLLHATWVPAWQTPSKEGKLRKSCEVCSVNVVSMAICFKPGSLFICVHHHAWCNSAITM